MKSLLLVNVKLQRLSGILTAICFNAPNFVGAVYPNLEQLTKASKLSLTTLST